MSTTAQQSPATPLAAPAEPPAPTPAPAATGDPAVLGLPSFVAAAVWAAALGQTLVACIFGLFAGFWWSYAVLVLGLNHNWFAIPADDVTHTVALFQITWAVVFAVLALATLRLPVAFTAVVVLVVLALIFLIIGTLNTDETMTKAAGYVTFVFAALGGYLFLSAASVATGGKGYPLGAPLVR
jgi:uncharacterized protein